MPIDLSKTILLERAFTPAPMPKISDDQLAIFYQESPYYALVLRGTIAENDNFSPEEQEQLNKFNGQFSQIITKIKAECKELGLEAKLLDNLDVFTSRILPRKYFQRQRADFYIRIKQSLETILLNLSGNTLLHNVDKKRIMTDLLKEIIYCGPGIFNHIETARQEISSHNTIEAWLAKFRKTLIKQIAHQHLTRKNISKDNIPHVEDIFLIYACAQGWNPYGGEALPALNEIHENLAAVTPQDLELFKEEFFKLYNPTSIMVELTNTLAACLAERINNKHKENNNGKNYIELQTNKELTDLFLGLPFINEEGMISEVFDSNEMKEEKEEKRPVAKPAAFIRFGHDLKLKPIKNLTLSLTQFLVESKDRRLFQALSEKTNLGRPGYTLVPQSPKLCYVHSPEGAVPLDETAGVFDLKLFKEFKIPLSQAQFEAYLISGSRNFDECILEGIDLSNYDIMELSFKNTQFKNIRMTPNKFIYLFNQGYRFSQLNYLESDVTDRIEEILAKTVQEKSILLFYAIASNQPGLIRILLGAGADAKILYASNNLMPIEIAAETGHWECVNAFAEKPENIRSEFRYGSALLNAAASNQLGTVKTLIRAGASVHWENTPNKMTALHYAAQHGNAEMVRMLLEAGANAGALNTAGKTPIQLATEAGHWECVKAFAVKQDNNNQFRYGLVLLLAAANNQLGAVQALTAVRTSPNRYLAIVTKMTALHFAAQHGNAEMVRTLLNAGANAGAFNTAGKTPIEIAADTGHWECVKELAVKQGNGDPFPYVYAFQKAAINNQLGAVQALAFTGAFYERGTPDTKMTALHFAAQHGNAEMVRTLLRAGADAGALNPTNKTPIQIAADAGHWECVKAFAVKQDSYGEFRYGEVLLRAAATNQLGAVQALVDAKAFLNCYYPGTKMNALHFATQHKNTEMVKILVSAGANPNTVNTAGEHAFNSIRGSRRKILDALLGYRAGKCSWTSEPESTDRKNDAANLLGILMKENVEDSEVLNEVYIYCTRIKTGFWDRSALRSNILAAMPNAAISPHA